MSLEFPSSVTVAQDNWCFCIRCLSLFWNGRADNGFCPAPNPANGPHVAVSWNFYLPADPAASITQDIDHVHTP